MSDLIEELKVLAEKLVELTTDQPTINDLKRNEEENEQVPSWSVWVGGGEVNMCYLSETQAQNMAQAWKDQGYDDVVVRRERE